VLDGKSGLELRKLSVPSPIAVHRESNGMLFVGSAGKEVLDCDPTISTTKTILDNLTNATSVTTDAAGTHTTR